MNPKVKRVNVSSDSFSPRVLRSYIFTHGLNLPDGFKLKERYVYDYEMEFILQSSGAMFIEEKLYPVRKGDVVFRRPGQKTQGIMPYTCYTLCFDLMGNTGKDEATYDFYKEQEFQEYYVNPVLDAIPDIFQPPMSERYYRLFDSVLKEYINAGYGSPLILKAYILQILFQLYTDVTNPFSKENMPSSPHYAAVKKVVEYIQRNIHSEISLSKISEMVKLSPNHFHKIFKSAMGVTPNEFITKLRLDRAKELLVKTSLPISEVALECGFENTPYFSYLFKKHLGVSPAEFRKRHNYV